jgi:hypothetical protein
VRNSQAQSQGNSSGKMNTKMELHDILHILRNPYDHSPVDIRCAQLEAAELLAAAWRIRACDSDGRESNPDQFACTRDGGCRCTNATQRMVCHYSFFK